MTIIYDRREIFRMILEIMHSDEETFMEEFEGITDQILAQIMGWA